MSNSTLNFTTCIKLRGCDYLYSNHNQIKIKNRASSEIYELINIKPSLADPVSGKKEISFSMTLTPDNSLAYNLLAARNTLIVDEESFKQQKYIITSISRKWAKGTWSRDVNAVHIFVWLLNYNQVRSTITGSISLDKAFSHALRGSGFTYKIMPDAKTIGSVEQENFGNNNSTSLIDEIVSDYGVELAIDNTHIYVFKNRGKNVNYIADGLKNVEGLSIQIDADECYTRAKGYGKYDEKTKKYLVEVEYVHPDEEKFLVEGRPIVGPPIEDEKYTKKSSMIEALKKYVNPYPNVTVELDLNTYKDPVLDGIEESFGTGDTIKILVDSGPEFGNIKYEEKVRVIEKKYNPLDDTEKPQLTFVSYKKKLTTMQAEEILRNRQTQRYIRSVSRKASEGYIEVSQGVSDLGNKVNEFSENVSKAEYIGYGTSLYTENNPDIQLKTSVKTIIFEYNGVTWGVTTSDRAVVSQKDFVQSVQVDGKNLLIYFKSGYFSLLSVSIEEDINLKGAGVSVGSLFNMGGDGSDKLTIGFAKSGTLIMPNDTSIVPGSCFALSMTIANPNTESPIQI